MYTIYGNSNVELPYKEMSTIDTRKIAEIRLLEKNVCI